MIILERNHRVTEQKTTGTKLNCQASFNSDGRITLRNYDNRNPNNDEIIILSNNETEALFLLFSRMEQKHRNYTFPF